MNGEPKQGATITDRAVRVSVSGVELRLEGRPADDRSTDLAATLGRVGRTDLVDALTRKVLAEAPTTLGAAGLTRWEAAAIARRIVDRLIVETRSKRS